MDKTVKIDFDVGGFKRQLDQAQKDFKTFVSEAETISKSLSKTDTKTDVEYQKASNEIKTLKTSIQELLDTAKTASSSGSFGKVADIMKKLEVEVKSLLQARDTLRDKLNSEISVNPITAPSMPNKQQLPQSIEKLTSLTSRESVEEAIRLSNVTTKSVVQQFKESSELIKQMSGNIIPTGTKGDTSISYSDKQSLRSFEVRVKDRLLENANNVATQLTSYISQIDKGGFGEANIPVKTKTVMLNSLRDSSSALEGMMKQVRSGDYSISDVQQYMARISGPIKLATDKFVNKTSVGLANDLGRMEYTLAPGKVESLRQLFIGPTAPVTKTTVNPKEIFSGYTSGTITKYTSEEEPIRLSSRRLIDNFGKVLSSLAEFDSLVDNMAKSQPKLNRQVLAGKGSAPTYEALRGVSDISEQISKVSVYDVLIAKDAAEIAKLDQQLKQYFISIAEQIKRFSVSINAATAGKDLTTTQATQAQKVAERSWYNTIPEKTVKARKSTTLTTEEQEKLVVEQDKEIEGFNTRRKNLLKSAISVQKDIKEKTYKLGDSANNLSYRAALLTLPTDTEKHGMPTLGAKVDEELSKLSESVGKKGFKDQKRRVDTALNRYSKELDEVLATVESTVSGLAPKIEARKGFNKMFYGKSTLSPGAGGPPSSWSKGGAQEPPGGRSDLDVGLEAQKAAARILTSKEEAGKLNNALTKMSLDLGKTAKVLDLGKDTEAVQKIISMLTSMLAAKERMYTTEKSTRVLSNERIVTEKEIEALYKQQVYWKEQLSKIAGTSPKDDMQRQAVQSKLDVVGKELSRRGVTTSTTPEEDITKKYTENIQKVKNLTEQLKTLKSTRDDLEERKSTGKVSTEDYEIESRVLTKNTASLDEQLNNAKSRRTVDEENRVSKVGITSEMTKHNSLIEEYKSIQKSTNDVDVARRQQIYSELSSIEKKYGMQKSLQVMQQEEANILTKSSTIFQQLEYWTTARTRSSGVNLAFVEKNIALAREELGLGKDQGAIEQDLLTKKRASVSAALELLAINRELATLKGSNTPEAIAYKTSLVKRGSAISQEAGVSESPQIMTAKSEISRASITSDIEKRIALQKEYDSIVRSTNEVDVARRQYLSTEISSIDKKLNSQKSEQVITQEAKNITTQRLSTENELSTLIKMRGQYSGMDLEVLQKQIALLEKELGQGKSQQTIEQEITQAKRASLSATKEMIALQKELASVTGTSREDLAYKATIQKKINTLSSDIPLTPRETVDKQLDENKKRMHDAQEQVEIMKQKRAELSKQDLGSKEYENQKRLLTQMIRGVEQYGEGFTKVQAPLRRLGDGLKSVLQTMVQLAEWQTVWYATKFFIMGAPQVVTMGIEFTKLIDQWNFNMLRWGATSGKVTEKMRTDVSDLVKSIRSSLTEVPIGFEDAAKAVEGLVAAGVKMNVVKDLVKDMSVLKMAFPEIDMEKFGIATVGAFNVFRQQIRGAQSEAGKFRIILEQLLKAQAESIVRPEAFAKIMQYMSSVGKIAGMSTEQIFGMSTVIADTGITANTTARLLASLIQQFSRPIAIEGFRKLGIEINKDATVMENMSKVASGLRAQIDTEGKLPLQMMTFFGRFIPKQEMKVFLGMIDQWEEIVRRTERIKSSQGSMDALLAERQKSMTGQLQLLKNLMNEIGAAGNLSSSTLSVVVGGALDAARGALLALNPELVRGKTGFDSLGAAGRTTYGILSIVKDIFMSVWAVLKPLLLGIGQLINAFTSIPGSVQIATYVGLGLAFSKLASYIGLSTSALKLFMTEQNKAKANVIQMSGPPGARVMAAPLATGAIPKLGTTGTRVQTIGGITAAASVGANIANTLTGDQESDLTKTTDKITQAGIAVGLLVSGVGTLLSKGTAIKAFFLTSSLAMTGAGAVVVGLVATLGTLVSLYKRFKTAQDDVNDSIKKFSESLKDSGNGLAAYLKLRLLSNILEGKDKEFGELAPSGPTAYHFTENQRTYLKTIGIEAPKDLLTANKTTRQYLQEQFDKGVASRNQAATAQDEAERKSTPPMTWPEPFHKEYYKRERELLRENNNLRYSMQKQALATEMDLTDHMHNWGLTSDLEYYKKKLVNINKAQDAELEDEYEAYRHILDAQKHLEEEEKGRIHKKHTDDPRGGGDKVAKEEYAYWKDNVAAQERIKIELTHQAKVQKIVDDTNKKKLTAETTYLKSVEIVRDQSLTRQAQLFRHQFEMARDWALHEVDMRKSMNDYLYAKLRISSDTFYNDQQSAIEETYKAEMDTAAAATKEWEKLNEAKLPQARLSVEGYSSGMERKEAQKLLDEYKAVLDKQTKSEQDAEVKRRKSSQEAWLTRIDDINEAWRAGNIVGVIAKTLDNIRVKAGTTATQIATAFENSWQSVSDGLSAMISDAENKFENLNDIILNMLKSIKNELMKSLVMPQIMGGLREGLKEYFPALAKVLKVSGASTTSGSSFIEGLLPGINYGVGVTGKDTPNTSFGDALAYNTEELDNTSKYLTTFSNTTNNATEKVGESITKDIADIAITAQSTVTKTMDNTMLGMATAALQAFTSAVMQATASMSGSSGSGLGGLFGGGGGASISAGQEAGMGSWLSTIGSGAYAKGGNVEKDKIILVGEKGPELFVPKIDGKIISNDKIGKFEARAEGGPVTSGKPYLVGEKGPELFKSLSSITNTIKDNKDRSLVTTINSSMDTINTLTTLKLIRDSIVSNVSKSDSKQKAVGTKILQFVRDSIRTNEILNSVNNIQSKDSITSNNVANVVKLVKDNTTVKDTSTITSVLSSKDKTNSFSILKIIRDVISNSSAANTLKLVRDYVTSDKSNKTSTRVNTFDTLRLVRESASKQLKNNLQFRADGGSVLTGKPYIVGEKGPEILIPKTSGTVVPNYMLMQQSQQQQNPPPVEINIQNNTGTPMKSSGQSNWNFDSKKWVKSIVFELADNDPSFRRKMGVNS